MFAHVKKLISRVLSSDTDEDEIAVPASADLDPQDLSEALDDIVGEEPVPDPDRTTDVTGDEHFQGDGLADAVVETTTEAAPAAHDVGPQQPDDGGEPRVSDKPTETPPDERVASEPIPSTPHFPGTSTKTREELLARPIPPRRNRRPAPPTEPVEPPAKTGAVASDEPEEVVVVETSADIDSTYVAKAHYADTDDDELAQLRLAVEASQNEMHRLASARDAALSQTAKQESLIEQLGSQRDSLQQDRESLSNQVLDLERDLSTLKSELQSEREVVADQQQKLQALPAETIEQIESQHQETVDELRSILGQREAAEASLLRERDSLSELTRQLQQKVDALQTDLAVAGIAGNDAQKEAATNQPEAAEVDGKLAGQLAELEMQHQQMSAELSLANETIRQLNQNLSQRDAQLMNLRHEHEATKSDLAILEATQSAQDNADSESDTAEPQIQADLDAAQRELRSSHEQLAASRRDLEASHDELESARTHSAAVQEQLTATESELESLKEAVKRLEEDLAAATASAQTHQEALSALQQEHEADTHSSTDRETELVTELEARQAQIDGVERQNLVLAQECETLRAETARLRDSFEGERAELHEQLDALEKARQQADETPVAELAEEVSSDTSDRIAELESAVEQHEHHTEALQREKQDLSDRVGAFQEEINAKSTEMRRMQERLKLAEENSEQKDRLQQACEEAQAAAESLQEAVDQKNVELKRLQDEQIELKQGLACLTDASECWTEERAALYQRFGLDENGDPSDSAGTDSDASEPPQERIESLQLRIQQLQTTVEERDRAYKELETRYADLQSDSHSADPSTVAPANDATSDSVLRAERDVAAQAGAQASATIAELLTELQATKQANAEHEAASEQLQQENREYRKSVAELHAVVNELEELRLERAREQDSARKRLREATTANAELTAELAKLRTKTESETGTELTESPQDTSNKLSALQQREQELERENGTLARKIDELQARLADRDERLQLLAQELSKSRKDLTTLKSELSEQKAVERSLSKQESKPASRNAVGDNGQPKESGSTRKRQRVSRVVKNETAKAKTSKRVVQESAADVPVAHDELGLIFTSVPARIDDLKRITGVGPALEKRLNAAGIYQFAQIKSWTKSTIENLDQQLSLRGRIRRDKWVAQARQLAAED